VATVLAVIAVFARRLGFNGAIPIKAPSATTPVASPRGRDAARFVPAEEVDGLTGGIGQGVSTRVR
jgi:hypothetical protein